jgi:hypothetical protein
MGIALTPQAGGFAASPDPIHVLGLEITQTIQNLAHEVPLLRGKRTVVRLYLEPPPSFSGTVRGEIAISPAAGLPALYVSSVNSVFMSAAQPGLARQRRSEDLSLNFVVPQEAIDSPRLVVDVKRLFTSTGDVPFEGSAPVAVRLEESPVLRVRAIGLRYVMTVAGGTSAAVSPEAFHFDRLRSFLLRAYPTAAIEWSQVVVQADSRITPPFGNTVWYRQLGLAHGQLAALRAKDIEGGTDPRTHYYGLISDQGGFFRGAANDVPTVPNPAVVAVGPAGDPSRYPALAWDTDPSFADWYGAHEIGHTFGRFHPGFCGQNRDDQRFPHADGRIGDPALDMIGFDVGDPALGLPLRAMPHERCHDLMTYCSHQWMSAYTYEGVLARLRDEDMTFAP